MWNMLVESAKIFATMPWNAEHDFIGNHHIAVTRDMNLGFLLLFPLLATSN